ncbi:MAG: hypothetical protein ACRDL8_18720, partial [Solirubrobacteraceae bacterium]
VDALLALPPLAARYTKEAANFVLDQAGFGALQELNAVVQRYLTLTSDSEEARAAIGEHRTPVFTGEHPRHPGVGDARDPKERSRSVT